MLPCLLHNNYRDQEQNKLNKVTLEKPELKQLGRKTVARCKMWKQENNIACSNSAQ